jgi:alpha-1,2-mannosyltransferase
MTAFPIGHLLKMWRAWSIGLLVALCVSVLLVGFSTASSIELYGWDFRSQYLEGGRAIVAGEPVYVAPDRATFEPIPPYVYPPLVAVLVTPYTVLPDRAAMVLAVVVCVGAVFGALAIVGVRDVRCYLAALASAPTWNLLETANVTAVLALALALMWRYRASVWPAALVIGLSVAAKLFLWPLVAWAWVTGRPRVAARAVAVAVGALMGSWALIRFQGLTDYPELVSRLDDYWAHDSYSLVGVASQLGLGRGAAAVIMVAVGGALLAMSWLHGRRGDDRRAFTCAIAAALALTPIAWVHYVWLLLVPLGLAQPRFSAIWLLPLLTWLVPRTGNGDGLEPFVPALVAALLVSFMLAPRRERLEAVEAT